MYFIFLPILMWLSCMFIDTGSDVRYKKRGGGGASQPETPAPAPSPSETSAEAISAQIEAVPRILQTQQEFGPQFTQQQLDELRQFGPEFAQAGLDLSQQFGPQFAQQVRSEQEILAPERVAGSEALADFIEGGPEDLTPEEVRQIQQDVRSAGSARGLAESGFSAQDEVGRLFNARQALKSRFLNIALSASGRLPAAGGQTVAPSPASISGQLVQNVTPSQIFGGQAAQNQFRSNIFSTQQQAATAQRGQNMSMIGDVIGGIAGGFGSFAGAGGKF